MIKVPEIDHFFSVSGYDGANKAIAMVTLTDKKDRKRTQTELQSVVRGLLRQLPDVRGTVSRISPWGRARATRTSSSSSRARTSTRSTRSPASSWRSWRAPRATWASPATWR